MLGQREFAQSALGLGYRLSLAEYLQQAELTFTDPLLPGGELIDTGMERELEPGGATRRVDVRNVHRWAQLVCARWLGDGVVAQAEAFRMGMADFVSVRALAPFTEREVLSMCAGEGQELVWDEATLRRCIRPRAPYSATSGVFQNLLAELLSSTAEQRRQFLVFVTSAPLLTLSLALNPIEIAPFPEALLPRASTCDQVLYLPE